MGLLKRKPLREALTFRGINTGTYATQKKEAAAIPVRRLAGQP
ncbi:hypothetical protein Q3A66_01695 [Hymenobacter sp. BT770]|nr:hypothetical protein [Hymenobacter sp. BT770]